MVRRERAASFESEGLYGWAALLWRECTLLCEWRSGEDRNGESVLKYSVS